MKNKSNALKSLLGIVFPDYNWFSLFFVQVKFVNIKLDSSHYKCILYFSS